jgi:hypothetical protein
MYAKKLSVFVILSLSIATVVMGTAGPSFLSTVYAGGDKCKDNGDHNCNDKNRNQKLKLSNDCTGKIEIKNTDADSGEGGSAGGHSAALSTSCENQGDAASLKDLEQANSTLFGSIDNSDSPF